MLRDEYSRTNMNEVLDGIDKDPNARWVFMNEMNLMFSLNEKEIRKRSHNLEIDKVIRRILKSKRASNNLRGRTFQQVGNRPQLS